MADNDWLAEQFEEKRGHLRGVAYRMLGSLAEADDAVQDAWLRLSRSGGRGVIYRDVQDDRCRRTFGAMKPRLS
jgi:hypothetical protein